MKNYFKTFFLFALSLIVVEVANVKATQNIISHINSPTKEESPQSDTVRGKEYVVCATMYYAVENQCDADPLVTAGMFHIDPKHASEQKWIAMSRDMIARWKGEFEYGDYVEIKGAGHKDGIYRVVDTMNKRFKNRIDFLETAGTPGYKFTNVTLTKIEWNEPNLLANL